MNHQSVNLIAEALLRQTGKHNGGDGSLASGINAVNAYFAKHQIEGEGLTIHDGAGLSRTNAVSPRQLVQLLKAADAHPSAGAFRRSLPVAGKSGTLKSVGKRTSAVGRIRAKSGTLERVKCYAGFADTRSGSRYAFALMVNQFSGPYADVKPGIEGVLARIAEM